MHIETWNEWDPLKSVIIGNPQGAQVPIEDISLRAINYADRPAQEKIISGPYPAQVIEEANEDIERLCTELSKLGVTVYRPEIPMSLAKFSSPEWESNSYYQYCPRDSILVHGTSIIETPMPLRSRYFENFAYKKIFTEAFKNGAQWLSAPRPRLSDELYLTENINEDTLTLKELEPCFDAANILRCGHDLFYLVSNSANKLGAQWLQSTLGSKFKVHLIENIYSYMHLDSTISLLRPGLALLNPARIKPDNIPGPLAKWDKIWAPEPYDIGHYPGYPHASTWIGMNLLMIHPQLAIVEQNQKALIKLLEGQKIDVLPLPMRHARTLGGAFHCVSLDLHREGKLESYF